MAGRRRGSEVAATTMLDQSGQAIEEMKDDLEELVRSLKVPGILPERSLKIQKNRLNRILDEMQDEVDKEAQLMTELRTSRREISEYCDMRNDYIVSMDSEVTSPQKLHQHSAKLERRQSYRPHADREPGVPDHYRKPSSDQDQRDYDFYGFGNQPNLDQLHNEDLDDPYVDNQRPPHFPYNPYSGEIQIQPPKLKALKLLCFGGDLLTYRTWRCQFRNLVLDNPSMSNGEKMMRLLSCLEGLPFNMVEHLGDQENGVNPAMARLDEAYGNPELQDDRFNIMFQRIQMCTKKDEDGLQSLMNVIDAIEGSDPNMSPGEQRRWVDVFVQKLSADLQYEFNLDTSKEHRTRSLGWCRLWLKPRLEVLRKMKMSAIANQTTPLANEHYGPNTHVTTANLIPKSISVATVRDPNSDVKWSSNVSSQFDPDVVINLRNQVEKLKRDNEKLKGANKTLKADNLSLHMLQLQNEDLKSTAERKED